MVYRALYPLFFLCAFLLAPFHKKVRAAFGLRLRSIKWPDWIGREPTLWVHCASGEFEYAKPVIEEWKKLSPECRVFVSYYSTSFIKPIEGHPLVDFSAPLPFDLPGPCKSFVTKVKPLALAISRTDIWPEVCHQVRQKKVPIFLFSATVSASNDHLGVQALIRRWRYSHVDHIYCVNEGDQTVLKNLNAKLDVKVMGDTRFDQVLKRLDHPKPLKNLNGNSKNTPCLVAGSTWPEDERALLPAVLSLLRANKLRLIIAPHEPTETHLSSLEKFCQQNQLSFNYYSKANNWTEPVLIIDQIGILAELYTWGDFAFVGGSFRQKVHSVMEPLAAGLITFTGPKIKNNSEALVFSQIPLDTELKVVNLAASSEELKNCLNAALNKQKDFTKFKTTIADYIKKQRGASARVVSQMLTTLGPHRQPAQLQ